MKIAKLAGGILLVVLTAYACGGKSTQAGGSNTNWFSACSSSRECGGELECWCGMCTKTCGGECSGNAAATCAAPPPSCADPQQAAKEQACAVQCVKDADCKGVGANATCVESICRKASSTSVGPDSGTSTMPEHDGGASTTRHGDSGALSCEELLSGAAAAQNALQSAADESCQTDDDCTSAAGLSCAGCGFSVVSKAGLAKFQSQTDALDRTWCKPLSDEGCALGPQCSLPAGKPSCVFGKCEYAILGAPTCDQMRATAIEQVQALIDGADESCRTDADCVAAPDPSCAGNCGFGAVSKTAAASIAASVSGIEQQVCKQFTSDGCTVIPPPCIFLGEPACVAGKCSTALGPPPDAGLSCAERTAQMRMELQHAADGADSGCATDADCKAIELINACAVTCTYVSVSASGAQAVEAKLSSLGAASCPAFTSAGCVPETLPCVSGGTPKCDAGMCTLQ